MADGLAASPWIRRLIVVPETASTNDDARALGSAGAPDGTIVIAERQTAGRGRLGREWHSPEGAGLYVSVLLRPQEPVDRIGRYALAAAVAACSAARACSGIDVSIKWPNDLLAGGLKVAGILSELKSGAAGLELVVGLGVNVNQEAEDFPPELRALATSLRAIRGGVPLDREAVALELLSAFGGELADLRAGSWSRVAERFVRYAPHVDGARVRLAAGGEGVTRGLDPGGALRVATPDGIVLVHASESVALVEE